MRRIFYFVFFALCLAACLSPVGCSPAPKTAPTHPPASTATLTAPTPTASLASNATPYPTETLAPPTITPLPTIPTFTPTFDARTIVTATPAPKAVCPKEDPAVKINFLIPIKFNEENVSSPQLMNDKKVLAYLNKGGSLSNLLAALQAGAMADRYRFQDFTGDGVKDLLIDHFLGPNPYSDIRIYSCIDGTYKSFSAIEDDWAPLQYASILGIKDLNKNGIPEIVIAVRPALLILEWQGSDFRRTELGGPHTQRYPAEIKDINHDGLDEIIFTGKEIHYFGFNEDVYRGAPWRDEIVVFSWDGSDYIQHPSEYSTPEYRFQAIQDGDRLTLQHNYEQAFALYQSAIFSDQLKEWSPEMHSYELGILNANMNSRPTPTIPHPDLTEYPRLAAYAYYRMIALHIDLGQMDAAQVNYATLQTKFPPGNPGHPYAEMATAFWDAYQSTGRMYNACGAAIAYADAHPEILIPLGSDYHGAQSHTYVPADVCPFR